MCVKVITLTFFCHSEDGMMVDDWRCVSDLLLMRFSQPILRHRQQQFKLVAKCRLKAFHTYQLDMLHFFQ